MLAVYSVLRLVHRLSRWLQINAHNVKKAVKSMNISLRKYTRWKERKKNLMKHTRWKERKNNLMKNTQWKERKNNLMKHTRWKERRTI
jgi:hypothetical protein